MDCAGRSCPFSTRMAVIWPTSTSSPDVANDYGNGRWRRRRSSILPCVLNLAHKRTSMPLVFAGAGQLRFLAFSLLLSLATVPTQAQLDPQTKQLSRDIFQQLIEINT